MGCLSRAQTDTQKPTARPHQVWRFFDPQIEQVLWRRAHAKAQRNKGRKARDSYSSLRLGLFAPLREPLKSAESADHLSK
jgi:hypothetical protein